MKVQRQSKIRELINNFDIETQDELAERLFQSGFKVTQATISRDIRDLKLTKIATQNGRQKYIIPSELSKQFSDKFIRIFKDAVISIDYAQNIVVIKTIQGMAMAVAATIDSMENNEILGSIAGDDTIFCLTKSEFIAVKLIDRLNQLIKQRN